MLCLLAAGVALGIGLRPDPTPGQLAAANYESDFRALAQPFGDEVDVDLIVTAQPGEELLAPAAGVVTQAWCRAGAKLTSGNRIMGISGQPMLGLATSVPPWRDFSAGATGEDVSALQAELKELNYNLSRTEKFDSATAAAVEDLIEDAGGTWTGTLPLGQIMWLPGEGLTVSSCLIELGDRITEGAPILKLSASTAKISLKSPNRKLYSGSRTLIIGETRIALPESLSLADAKTQAEIKASAAYGIWRESKGKVPLTARLELTKPLEVYSVPPSALAGLTSDQPCLISQGQKVPVTIISSSLGLSLVKARAGKIPELIDSRVPAGAECR